MHMHIHIGELFIFKNGTIVFWNVSPYQILEIRQLLKSVQINSYNQNQLPEEEIFYEYDSTLETSKVKKDRITFAAKIFHDNSSNVTNNNNNSGQQSHNGTKQGINNNNNNNNNSNSKSNIKNDGDGEGEGEGVFGNEVEVDEDLERKKVTMKKFAISDALSLSVKLDIWEDIIEDLADSISHIPEDMMVCVFACCLFC